MALALAAPAEAGSKYERTTAEGKPAKARTYRKAPEVRGYVARRGGYSYSASDVINTYGLTRSIYGGANSFRDPMLDRQTPSGPFDHGFFFDSGVGPRGGNAPYPN